MGKNPFTQSEENQRSQEKDSENCCENSSCCTNFSRKDFLKLIGMSGIGLLSPQLPVMAGPFTPTDFDDLIPPDKKLQKDWVESLFDRGEPTIYQGEALDKIGMPVGGIYSGMVYLGGDGKLWYWNIFNKDFNAGNSGPNYADPLSEHSPLDQGFAIRVIQNDETSVRSLDKKGFSNIRFRGEYPIGHVEYHDQSCPVKVSLDAFSPFIPLNEDESGFPATIMEYTLENTSKKPLETDIVGWLENAVCLDSGQKHNINHRNQVFRHKGMTLLECSAEKAPEPKNPIHPPEVFADFSGEDYKDWEVSGTAFGKQPVTNKVGEGRASSKTDGESHKGKLISPPFTIHRPFINFLIAGGRHPYGYSHNTSIELLIEDEVKRSASGHNQNQLEWTSWDVSVLQGKKARIRIEDNRENSWGFITVDHIEFSDNPRKPLGVLASKHDYGTMTLTLLDSSEQDIAHAEIPAKKLPDNIFDSISTGKNSATASFDQKLRGGLERKLIIKPGEKKKVRFIISWFFPHIKMDYLSTKGGRYYANRFDSSSAVASYIADNYSKLTDQTRLWRDTWYDSTLPYWFLDRTFANTALLATSTVYRFSDGRFYGYEGIGCCLGTCTHVWHYAQAVARIFPALERDTRERVDFGIAFNEETGLIKYRGEYAGEAVDGQAGTILRAYREHQMAPDRSFLNRNWKHIKLALNHLIEIDGNSDGILEGAQHNTLDAAWYGKISSLSSLYIAALQAGEAMAREVNDLSYADRVHQIWKQGSKLIAEELWNGEYFYQKADPSRPHAVGAYEGSFIDQVIGQWWCHQVGLERILPQQQTKKALQSLWKYNFTPDVGPYRKAHEPGRWYAMAGEGGLIMVTYPHGNKRKLKDPNGGWTASYFNECMTGFEHQAAGHMIWEGLLKEGLAVTRTIHDRYHALKRNPWNEIECSDHYARSMASYGSYLALCGYEFHGPKGHLGFAPRLRPENFKAAFTGSEGWGSFHQQRSRKQQTVQIILKWGKLKLNTLKLELPENQKPKNISVHSDESTIPVELNYEQQNLFIHMEHTVYLHEGEKLTVEVELARIFHRKLYYNKLTY